MPLTENNLTGSSEVNDSSSFPKVDNASYSVTSADTTVSQNIMATLERTEVSSGPLPHPELLKGYNEIIPNGAERIMRMAEKEQENRFSRKKRDTGDK